jgi:hypothetical protein
LAFFVVKHDLKSLHWPLDVFEREPPEIAKFGRHSVHHGVSGIAGNEDAARRRLPFETSCDIHAIAV